MYVMWLRRTVKSATVGLPIQTVKTTMLDDDELIVADKNLPEVNQTQKFADKVMILTSNF